MRYSVSPLRYPGGKGKMYNHIKKIILDNQLYKCTYVEPFAGGAAIAIKLLLNNQVERIILNDLDRSIYAIWHSILNNSEEFINRIQTIDVTIQERSRQRKIYDDLRMEGNLLDLGFATFFLNRTNRSGIIEGGPIGGYDQTSKYKIDCRFYRDELISRVKEIAKFKDRIDLYNLDAVDFISNVVPKVATTFAFIDPPYYKKGKELYLNFYNNEDHKTLHDAIVRHLSSVATIITYDDVEEIKKIYSDFKHLSYTLQYSAATVAKGKEIMFYKKDGLKIFV